MSRAKFALGADGLREISLPVLAKPTPKPDPPAPSSKDTCRDPWYVDFLQRIDDEILLTRSVPSRGGSAMGYAGGARPGGAPPGLDEPPRRSASAEPLFDVEFLRRPTPHQGKIPAGARPLPTPLASEASWHVSAEASAAGLTPEPSMSLTPAVPPLPAPGSRGGVQTPGNPKEVKQGGTQVTPSLALGGSFKTGIGLPKSVSARTPPWTPKNVPAHIPPSVPTDAAKLSTWKLARMVYIASPPGTASWKVSKGAPVLPGFSLRWATPTGHRLPSLPKRKTVDAEVQWDGPTPPPTPPPQLVDGRPVTPPEALSIPRDGLPSTWYIDASVFAPRVKESDSRDYFDDMDIWKRRLNLDWKRMCKKSKYIDLISRAVGQNTGTFRKSASSDVPASPRTSGSPRRRTRGPSQSPRGGSPKAARETPPRTPRTPRRSPRVSASAKASDDGAEAPAEEVAAVEASPAEEYNKELREIKAALFRNFETISRAFAYFCAIGTTIGEAAYSMGYNQYLLFLEDTEIPDESSKACKASDCDTMFVLVNWEDGDKNSVLNKANDDRALMRFEFLEMVVRLGIAKYGDGVETNDISDAVDMLCARNIQPHLCYAATLDNNIFRRNRLYNRQMDELFIRYRLFLQTAYRWAKATGRVKLMGQEHWIRLLETTGVIGERTGVSKREAKLAFVWSQMTVIDAIKHRDRAISMTYVDFLEALGRVADICSPPTEEELDKFYRERNQEKCKSRSKAWEYFKEAPLQYCIKHRRQSADEEATPTRPLHVKAAALIEIMLFQLMFRYKCDSEEVVISNMRKDMTQVGARI